MYIPTIGLEIHVELKTKTKMFCACLNDAHEKKPNVNVCPVCLGHPGALPAINRAAVNEVLKLGLVIGGKLAKRSHFDRKSYFYPDLPKGYQISQYDEPFVLQGALNGIRITRVHLEEDAGRLLHDTEQFSLVDFNRAGVPLMELVTEPDIKNAEEAVKFAKSLQKIMRYLGASDADMEKGQMRVEVNVSIAPKHESVEKKLGTKVEIKNLNSFKAVQNGIEYEIKRQRELLEAGEKILHETRGWDDKNQKTVSQRGKELSHDYRYFPEPDLPPLTFTDKDFELLVRELPEMPEQKKTRFMREYTLTEQQAELITDDLFWADFFEKAASEFDSQVAKPKFDLLFNYLVSDFWGLLSGSRNVEGRKIATTPEHFASLVALVQNGKCTSRMAKDLLLKMVETGEDPEVIMKSQSIELVTDSNTLLEIVKNIIKTNLKAVEEYKNGKVAALQFLVGAAMRETKGQADPERLRELLEKELG